MVRVFQALFIYNDVKLLGVDVIDADEKLPYVEKSQSSQNCVRCVSDVSEIDNSLNVAKTTKLGKGDFFRDGIRCLFGLNSTQISGIQDPIRLILSLYGWSHTVFKRNLKKLIIGAMNNKIAYPFCKKSGASEEKRNYSKNNVEEGEKIQHPGIKRNVAELIAHKQRIANDIEKNPGPPMVNINWMKMFLGFEANIRIKYKEELIESIKHLHENAKKKKIPLRLYSEENLNTIQDIFELCIKEKYASAIMLQVEFLKSHWYKKVREIEESTDVVSNEIFIGGLGSDKETQFLGKSEEQFVDVDENQAVTASSFEKVKHVSGKSKKVPNRARSSYEVVKQEAHWECPWCQKAFRRKNGCNKHIQDRHPYGGNQEAQYMIPVPKETNLTVVASFNTTEQPTVLNNGDSMAMFMMPESSNSQRHNFATQDFQLTNPAALFQQNSVQLSSHQESQPQVPTNLDGYTYMGNSQGDMSTWP